MSEIAELDKKLAIRLFDMEKSKLAGLPNIIEKLINQGEVITTVTSSDIFFGGVENFLRTEVYEGGVGVYRITLDTSLYDWVEFKDFKARQKKALQDKIDALHSELDLLKDELEKY